MSRNFTKSKDKEFKSEVLRIFSKHRDL